LAAWLAGQFTAARLVLVKSVALSKVSVRATALARRGIVDPAFPTISRAAAAMAGALHADHAAMSRAQERLRP
jgi:hypothetical protein